MTINSIILLAANLVAVAILSFGIYYPRHKKRELTVAFFGANIGVFAIASVLGGLEVSMGLGLGLFGVLSIIRLRSSEISQRDVAYYFSALALGLIAGLSYTNLLVPLALMTLILGAIGVVDSKLVLSKSEHQTVRLDSAIVNESELTHTLEQRLQARVLAVQTLNIDFVNETTEVDVRFIRKRVTQEELVQTKELPHVHTL